MLEWDDNVIPNFFPDFFGETFRITQPSLSQTKQSPRCETTESEMITSFDVPGLKPGDVEVSVQGNILSIDHTIRGEKRCLRYTIDDGYDTTLTSARLEHGVLEIRMPRSQKSKQQKIVIEIK